MSKMATYRIFWTLAAILFIGACSGQSTLNNQRLAEATREIGEAYMRQGDYTSALRELTKAMELNPEDPIVHYDLGTCYMAKNRLPDAIAHLKKTIALKPSYAPARNNLGIVYLRMEEWDAAIAIFEEITKDALYATPHYPLANLGKAYYHKGQYQKSLEYYKQALRIQDNFFIAQWGAGRTYLALNKGRLALHYLEKAVKQAPQVAQIHFELGEANMLVGKTDQAIISYETVIELTAPESVLAARAKQRIGMLR
jgi:tetratricopeptide (TPR) repeat protein